jgi:hypothetical protein
MSVLFLVSDARAEGGFSEKRDSQRVSIVYFVFAVGSHSPLVSLKETRTIYRENLKEHNNEIVENGLLHEQHKKELIEKFLKIFPNKTPNADGKDVR